MRALHLADSRDGKPKVVPRTIHTHIPSSNSTSVHIKRDHEQAANVLSNLLQRIAATNKTKHSH